jgi:hypothetical protein
MQIMALSFPVGHNHYLSFFSNLKNPSADLHCPDDAIARYINFSIGETPV